MVDVSGPNVLLFWLLPDVFQHHAGRPPGKVIQAGECRLHSTGRESDGDDDDDDCDEDGDEDDADDYLESSRKFVNIFNFIHRFSLSVFLHQF